jgi:hypothetical protein
VSQFKTSPEPFDGRLLVDTSKVLPTRSLPLPENFEEIIEPRYGWEPENFFDRYNLLRRQRLTEANNIISKEKFTLLERLVLAWCLIFKRKL